VCCEQGFTKNTAIFVKVYSSGPRLMVDLCSNPLHELTASHKRATATSALFDAYEVTV